MKILSKIIDNNASETILWLHGWGQNHKAWTQILPLFDEINHIALDMPGFGESDLPDRPWGSADYAACLWQEIETLAPGGKYLSIAGHSFGGKVALQMAAQRPDTVKSVILLGASGLPRKRSAFQRLRILTLKYLGKLARFSDSIFKTRFRASYEGKFGSTDYKNAQGILRDILVTQINENLTDMAEKTTTTTLIIYGEKDSETPPEIGARYHHLIKNSQFYKLPALDHYTILTNGRYQLQNLISNFLKGQK